MPNPFTHDVEFVLGEKEFNGEVEFNTDGIATYKFVVEPRKSLREAYLINKLFEILQELNALNGEMVKLEITKKEE